MRKELCKAIVVNSKYERYIPYFAYFANQSYPDADIKIFFTSELSKKTIKALGKINVKKNIKVINNFFAKMPSSNQELKTFRWLIPQYYTRSLRFPAS